jgi:hypothetical protein
MTPPTLNQAGAPGLHVRYEKDGLILDALPIPWNADAVIVEANVRLPALVARTKEEFTLQFSSGAPTAWAEVLMQPKKHGPMRVFFRIPVPALACTAQFFWREHLLGHADLPIITASAFAQGFALEMQTLYATLDSHTVACQSFVGPQVKTVFASAVVRGSGPLAAALDLGLCVNMQRSNGQLVGTVPVSLTSEQRRARQALTTVLLPKPRALGTYQVTWQLGSRSLHAQTLRVVTKKTFLASLRISATRFIVNRPDGTRQSLRSLLSADGRLMLDGIESIAPVFFVSSSEPGMAGLAPFTLRALVGDILSTLAIQENVLVTDGPTPIVLGSVPVGELTSIKHFTLGVGATILGNLPLVPVPKADFNAEGGFVPLDDYLWSAAAEEQLNDRLGKLLDGG